jgi:hypothetical protein
MEKKSFAVELFAKGFGGFSVGVAGIHLCRAFRDSPAGITFFDFLPYPYQPPVELLFGVPLAICVVLGAFVTTISIPMLILEYFGEDGTWKARWYIQLLCLVAFGVSVVMMRATSDMLNLW